jgi:hypothetical protein
MAEIDYIQLVEAMYNRESLIRLDGGSMLPISFSTDPRRMANTVTKTSTERFAALKKSLKEIEAEPFTGEARSKIEQKINRLQKVGAVGQALLLEKEIRTRESLIRLKDWDYKILPKKTIDMFEAENKVTLTTDGLKLHIDPLEKYYGNPKNGNAKDRIIPNDVLEKIEDAQERELFDEFQVLWAAKVKDPIILGCIDGCEDYFFVAEWGDDISFDEIVKEK